MRRVESAIAPMQNSPPKPELPGGGVFATTNWTVVLSAKGSTAPGQAAALEQLCQTYWYPLYAYVRRRGYSHEDAQDLIQGFFAQLLDRRSFGRVSPDKGKFRSFLLASLGYFLADDRDRNRARKRGGGQPIISIEAQEAEDRYRLEPVEQNTPEKLFERRWALAILEHVLKRLEMEYAASGKSALFQELQPFLLGDKSHGTYQESAVKLGSTEGAIKMAVSRLRQRYRELFREIIAQTVADPSEIEEEFSHLFSVIAGG